MYYDEPTFQKKITGKSPLDDIRKEATEAAKKYGKTILYAHFSPIFHTPDTHGNEEYCKLLKLIVAYIDWEDEYYQTRICLTKSLEPALPPS